MSKTGDELPPRDICERTRDYALRALRLFRSVRKARDEAAWLIARQYLRAATSIGAMIEEAQAAESRADFIHKYAVARKEAREARYWLILLAHTQVVPAPSLEPLKAETEQLLRIISSIILTAQARRRE